MQSDPFHDPDLTRALRDSVLPIVATCARPKFWHAGCATGEDAFSSAKLLDEHGIYDRTAIFATDRNRRSIAVADQIALRSDLAKNICFFEHDLANDDVFAEVDVLFCRNVLARYEAPVRDVVALKLARSIGVGGFLCLGRDEALPPVLEPMFSEVHRGIGIHRYAGAP